MTSLVIVEHSLFEWLKLSIAGANQVTQISNEMSNFRNLKFIVNIARLRHQPQKFMLQQTTNFSQRITIFNSTSDR